MCGFKFYKLEIPLTILSPPFEWDQVNACLHGGIS